MKRAALISVTIFFVTILLTVTVWSSEKNRCVQNIYGKTYCPPLGVTCIVNSAENDKIICTSPYGGIVTDMYGKALCGPGKCMIDPFGKAFCSSEQGGSVTLGSKGEPVCTGECLPASESACSFP